MKSWIIKSIAIIAPKFFLPTGTKMRNGERLSLNIQERRAFLEQNLTHHLDQFLNKYSPIRRSIQFYKNQRLKRKQDQFHCLMGQIALTHAGIEQDLKNTLTVDWDVDEKAQKMEYSGGKLLQKKFITLLKTLIIPEVFLKEYEALIDELVSLSERRNEAVKAIYAFSRDTAEISQIHKKNHGKYDGSMTYEERINSWIPKVNLIDMEGLLEDLVALRSRFIKLGIEVSRNKSELISELCSEIGKIYPEYAFKNPYKYKASLEESVDKKV